MHKPISEICGCFPTGMHYPGITDYIEKYGRPGDVGRADDIHPDTPFSELPFMVIDTETTGFSVNKGDRILEIALISFLGPTCLGKYSYIVNPERSIPYQSTQVHGLTDEMVRNRPLFSEYAEEIEALLWGSIPLAYNAQFDRRFVFYEMQKAGITPSKSVLLPPGLRTCTDWIDPLPWARFVLPGHKSNKLSDVAQRVKVSLDSAHQASADAEATGHVFAKLMERMPEMTYKEIIQKQREIISEGYNHAMTSPKAKAKTLKSAVAASRAKLQEKKP